MSSQSQPCGDAKRAAPTSELSAALRRVQAVNYIDAALSTYAGSAAWSDIQDEWEVITTSLLQGNSDAELTALVPELLGALKLCRSRFEEYALLHYRKRTAEGDAKAMANQQMATLCDNAIGKAAGGVS